MHQDTITSFRLPTPTAEAVKAQAQAQRVSASEVVRCLAGRPLSVGAPEPTDQVHGGALMTTNPLQEQATALGFRRQEVYGRMILRIDGAVFHPNPEEPWGTAKGSGISIRHIERRNAWLVQLMARRDLKPTRKTSAAIRKLAEKWSEIVYPGSIQRWKDAHPGKRISYSLAAQDGSMAVATKKQALAMAIELWAIIGEPGAYEYVEPHDEDEEEDNED